tara:strand:+ start:485 stop:787 length:303 start_codon:yes stop_codon:yes gene_type:complete
MKKLSLFLIFAIGFSACTHTRGSLSEINPTGVYQLVGSKNVVCVKIDNYGATPVRCSQFRYGYMHIIDILDDPPRGYYSNKEDIVLGMILRESTLETDNH